MVKIPTPNDDGNLFVAEYLLNRWEQKGQVQMDWLDSSAKGEIIYIINGKRYHYLGVRLAPKVNTRRRTFLVAELKPID